MATKGSWISGIASTRSRWYEKMPSTDRATITIVAKTGWLIATRVIHMASARGRCVRRERLYHLGAAQSLDAGRQAMLQVVELRREHILGSLHAGEDLDQVSAIIARAGGDRPALDAVADDEPDKGLHAFAAHRRNRQRARIALGVHGEAHAGEHAGLEKRALVLERYVDVDRARARLGARVDALDLAVEGTLRQAFDLHARRH